MYNRNIEGTPSLRKGVNRMEKVYIALAVFGVILNYLDRILSILERLQNWTKRKKDGPHRRK